jgi:hypothetical protein
MDNFMQSLIRQTGTKSAGEAASSPGHKSCKKFAVAVC